MKTALVTGITGQDGSYLAELLIGQGYRVVGAVRSSGADVSRIRHIQSNIEFVTVDFLDSQSVLRAVELVCPDEIYNLGGMASSAQLFEDAEELMQINGLAAVRWLNAIRQVNPEIRFCQASSSEMFGNTNESPQREETCFHPRNPYGVAKLCAHWSVGIYREKYGVHASSCILFNHESPRRGLEFVTRKITKGVSDILAGRRDLLKLGDLDARRDWGYAKDYMHGMWLMLQQREAGDYVLATGKTHSVRDFCEVAFRRVGLDYTRYVTSEPESARRGDAALLVGDAGKAHRKLGWERTVSFEELVHLMVDEDVRSHR